MIDKLQNLVIDEALNLEKIKNASKNQSFMEILGVGHKELQHSNFLKWLFDPSGSHQIGDYFLRGFINLLNFPADKKIVINLSDLADTTILREKENIDILVSNKKLKFTICIENKIWHGLAEHQLPKYYEIVERKKEEEEHLNLYVFLTPFPRYLPPEFEGIYQNITYSTVLNLINSTIENNNIPEENLAMISDYLNNLNKNILGQTSEIQLAQAIYQRHKTAIDFIWQYRPNFGSLFKEIGNYFSESQKYENLTPNDGQIIRILPKQISNKFKHLFGSWGETDAMFAIELFCEADRVWIKFCFGGINNAENKSENQKIKDDYFQTMKEFSSLAKYKVQRSKSTSTYPSVANVELIRIDDKLVLESASIMEAFIKKFEEFERNTLNQWEKEVNEKIK